MTLQQIGQYLYSLLIQVAGLVAPLAEVLRLEQISAKEKVPYFISNEVTSIAENVVALQAAVATLSATLELDNTAILLAISEVQQAGSPVTLPTTTPSGGTWIDNSNIGTAVWTYVPPYTGTEMVQDTMSFLSGVLNVLSTEVLFPYEGNPHFGLYMAGSRTTGDAYPGLGPTVQTASILASDSVLTWLTREEPTFDWAPWAGCPDYIAAQTTDEAMEWICLISPTDLTAIQALLMPSRHLTAPVWPGLTGVTLLTPVALDIGVTIAEACSGAIIDITAVPSKQGQFALGDMTSWRNVGAIAFVDDNGEAEYPQTLGLVHGVYLAKSMAVAAGLVLRASPGVTGTVTPFTIP